MAKIAIAKAKNENVLVTHKVERVNLYEFGYEKAGSVKGDPDVYAAYLDRILNGDLVEDERAKVCAWCLFVKLCECVR